MDDKVKMSDLYHTDHLSDSRIIREIIAGIRLFALDMDGTVYLGEKWIEGAVEFLNAVERSGRRYVFLTNNSSKNPESYIQKLHKMGLDVGTDRIITSGDATIDMLKRRYPDSKVYLLGNDLLKKQFADAGIAPVNDELEEAYRTRGNIIREINNNRVNMVVVGFDTSLDYLKLSVTCDLVRSGLTYVTTHPDYNCPTETGFIPDAGAIHAFVEASAGRRPDIIVGKPESGIVDYLINKTGFNKEDIAMVGDRLYTDIATGVRAGLTSILVLSGETKEEDLEASDIKPDLVIPSVAELIQYL